MRHLLFHFFLLGSWKSDFCLHRKLVAHVAQQRLLPWQPSRPWRPMEEETSGIMAKTTRTVKSLWQQVCEGKLVVVGWVVALKFKNKTKLYGDSVCFWRVWSGAAPFSRCWADTRRLSGLPVLPVQRQHKLYRLEWTQHSHGQPHTHALSNPWFHLQLQDVQYSHPPPLLTPQFISQCCSLHLCQTCSYVQILYTLTNFPFMLQTVVLLMFSVTCVSLWGFYVFPLLILIH